MLTPAAIPNKLYFRIGEVAGLLSVKPYVLRYWETEFPDIRPAKSKSGQRLYKRRDVELLVHIKELLYGERFTINGARKRLRALMRQTHPETQPQMALNLHPERRAASPPPTRHAADPPVKTSTASVKVLSKIKKDLQGLLESLTTK